MITLRPTPQTEKKILDRLKLIENLGRPQSEMTHEIQRGILQGFAHNFATESGGGLRWAALSPYTIEDRLSQGYGVGPILQRSGDYRASWVNERDGNHLHRLYQGSGKWTMEEGSHHPLTPYHEQGTLRMPARPTRFLNKQSEDELRHIVYRHLFRLLSRGR